MGYFSSPGLISFARLRSLTTVLDTTLYRSLTVLALAASVSACNTDAPVFDDDIGDESGATSSDSDSDSTSDSSDSTSDSSDTDDTSGTDDTSDTDDTSTGTEDTTDTSDSSDTDDSSDSSDATDDTGTSDGGLTPEDCLEDFSDEAWWAVALHDGANGPVQPAEADIDFVGLHMCWLRLTNPDLAAIEQYQAWDPTSMFAGLVPMAPTDDYEMLKVEYDAIADETPYQNLPDLHLLTFSSNYNYPALAAVFAALDEVEYADPNFLLGGENDRYEYQPFGDGVWRWFIYDEFWDCFDGCDCVRTWSYDVDHDSGEVTMISYSENGQPWCEF